MANKSFIKQIDWTNSGEIHKIDPKYIVGKKADQIVDGSMPICVNGEIKAQEGYGYTDANHNKFTFEWDGIPAEGQTSVEAKEIYTWEEPPVEVLRWRLYKVCDFVPTMESLKDVYVKIQNIYSTDFGSIDVNGNITVDNGFSVFGESEIGYCIAPGKYTGDLCGCAPWFFVCKTPGTYVRSYDNNFKIENIPSAGIYINSSVHLPDEEGYISALVQKIEIDLTAKINQELSLPKGNTETGTLINEKYAAVFKPNMHCTDSGNTLLYDGEKWNATPAVCHDDLFSLKSTVTWDHITEGKTTIEYDGVTYYRVGNCPEFTDYYDTDKQTFKTGFKVSSSNYFNGEVGSATSDSGSAQGFINSSNEVVCIGRVSDYGIIFAKKSGTYACTNEAYASITIGQPGIYVGYNLGEAQLFMKRASYKKIDPSLIDLPSDAYGNFVDGTILYTRTRSYYIGCPSVTIPNIGKFYRISDRPDTHEYMCNGGYILNNYQWGIFKKIRYESSSVSTLAEGVSMISLNNTGLVINVVADTTVSEVSLPKGLYVRGYVDSTMTAIGVIAQENEGTIYKINSDYIPVSGTNDGQKWTSLTIGDTTKEIVCGSSYTAGTNIDITNNVISAPNVLTANNPTGTGTLSMNNSKFTVDADGNIDTSGSITASESITCSTANINGDISCMGNISADLLSAERLSDGINNTKTVTEVLNGLLPSGTTAGQALVYNGTNWSKQNGYAYSTQETLIEWDGNTTGLPVVDYDWTMLYKVADPFMLTFEQFRDKFTNKFITTKKMSTGVEATYQIGGSAIEKWGGNEYAYRITGYDAWVVNVTQETEIGKGTTFPAGLYLSKEDEYAGLGSYVIKIEEAGVTTKFDPKYIPVSGENDGTNWTSLTIGDTTKNIPAGGSSYTAGSNIDITDNVISATGLLTTTNPTGTGSLSLNRKASTTIGYNSVATGTNSTASEHSAFASGYNTQATGSYSSAFGSETWAAGVASHAEGYQSKASNQNAHAEGYSTTASGADSHAEGDRAAASAYAAHAEGYATTASGFASHAEGDHTTANHRSQHTFGEYNIIDDSSAGFDARGNYVEIVGNGTYSAKSNARTLDWSGNETIAGNLQAAGLTDGTTTRTMSEILAAGEASIYGVSIKLSIDQINSDANPAVSFVFNTPVAYIPFQLDLSDLATADDFYHYLSLIYGNDIEVQMAYGYADDDNGDLLSGTFKIQYAGDTMKDNPANENRMDVDCRVITSSNIIAHYTKRMADDDRPEIMSFNCWKVQNFK